MILRSAVHVARILARTAYAGTSIPEERGFSHAMEVAELATRKINELYGRKREECPIEMWEELYVIATLHGAFENELVRDDATRFLFGEETCASLQLLRHTCSALSYNDYIDSVCNSDNIHAIIVKWADLTHHLDPNRVENLTKSHRQRYEKALAKISKALEEMTG